MFAMFIVPNLYVLYIYKTGNLPTTSTTEKGIFFKPFIDLKNFQFSQLDSPEQLWHKEEIAGKWALLNIVDENCEQHCLERAFNTQQAITALTRYKGRVEQIILVHPSKINNEDLNTIVHLKDYVHGIVDVDLIAELRSQIPQEYLSAYTVIVDPEGKLLLWYTPDQSLQDILRDIKRLLKSSTTGYSSDNSTSPQDTNSLTIEP